MKKESSDQQYKQVDKFIVTNKLLGKGAFGMVYRGFFKADNSKMAAIKVIPIEKISQEPRFLDLLKREIDIMTKIVHPNIVKMYGASRTARNLYMFLEYCKDGDLKTLLKKNGGRLSEAEAKLYLKQITDGFRALQAHQVIHRDIKPANILLHEGIAKITDFGFARVIDIGTNEQGLFSTVGTPLYMSPQILSNTKFSSKCDIWSLGMMFYEMLYGRTPWTAQSPYYLLQNIKNQKLQFDSKPQRSEEAKNLLRRMLTYEDTDRISWEELFESDYIKGNIEKIKKGLQSADTESDDLTKSIARAKVYCEANKVMTFNKNVETNELFAQKQQNASQKSSSHQSTDNSIGDTDYENPEKVRKIIDKQDCQKEQRDIIMILDSFFSYERNIAIFVNYASTLFFNFYNNNKTNKSLNLTEDLFYKIFFLFQKYQIIIFRNIIDAMINGKQNIIDPKSWDIYSKSSEYQTTLQAIKNDKEFMLPYFQEVLKRTKQMNKQNQIKQIEQIINEQFEYTNNQFQKLYEESLKNFIDSMKPHLKGPKPLLDRDFLLTIRFSLICLSPKEEFIWNADSSKATNFHTFYEQYEYIDEQSILMEILKHKKMQ